MAERKVLNKYFPPDFDPAKLPKLKLAKDRQYVVRLMAPFNMRCLTCGEYIYKGKKFNARKETVLGEEYLGLLIFRFYIRCPRCISEITFKTDPENTDYVCEKGATRNFQAQRLMEQAEEKLKQELEEEEANNPMKALENRTKESKHEMDVLEKLEELRELNARHASVDYNQLLEENKRHEKEMLEKSEREDEDLVMSIFGPKTIEKRLSDSDSDEDDEPSTSKNIKNNISIKRSNPTDLLTQESSADPPPPSKKPKMWDKGVGKIASNKSSLLQGLVKPKKQDKTVKDLNKPHTSITVTTNSDKTKDDATSLNSVQSKSHKSQVSAKPASLGLLGDYGSDQSSSGSED